MTRNMQTATVMKRARRTSSDPTLRGRAAALLAALRESRAEATRFALLGLATVLLLYAAFPSRSLWPLAFVCLAPWTFAVCRTQRAWVVHWGSFLAGWVFFLIGLRWLMPVTGLGYAALAFYLAVYWTICAWAIRTARRVGISPLWTLPVVWTACEYLRAWVMTGFPWLFVGHSLYRQLTLIQIADLTGVYGVTFLAALANGALAEWALLRWPPPGERPTVRQAVAGSTVALTLIAAALVYGGWRMRQADLEPGPRVAVVQEDFPLVNRPPYGDHPYTVFARYLRLAAEATATRPDLVVLPETVSSYPQNAAFLEVQRQAVDEESAVAWTIGTNFHEATAAFARGDYAAVNAKLAEMERQAQSRLRRTTPDGKLPALPGESGPPVTVVFGAVSVDVLPESTYPRKKRFNSALIYDRDGTQRSDRYDKIHLVPFGESVPFRNATFLGVSLHPLYRFLNRLSPFSYGGTYEYSLWSGDRYTVFELEHDGRVSRFGVPICYEDVMPYIARNFVWDGATRRVDFLVNISNDGWFLHSDELPQHLAICAFRAIENRVTIARAVNTGISGFIDPNGRVFSLVEKNGRAVGPGVTGYSVANVMLDRRSSVYGRFGDVFAGACLAASLPLWVGGIVTRWVFAIRNRIRAILARRGA